MKQIIMLCVAGLMLLSGCKKEPKYKNSGSIDGYDAGSCSGYIVSIDGGNSYRCPVLPAGNTITPKSSFPIKIDFNYTTNHDKCLGHEVITITGMIATY